MKKNIIMAIVPLFLSLALFAENKTENKKDESWKNKKFTAEELKKYDGKNGNPVYVAVDGIVYDVSKSKYWKTGSHMKMHQAGNDLTKDIKEKAPQGIHKGGKILEKMPKVGVLVPDNLPVKESKQEEKNSKKEIVNQNKKEKTNK
ncbi:MAG: cytochrome b5 domain-containing protein [Elusimicrobiota bacterium]